MVGVWLDFDTSIIQPWPSTNKPHLGPLEGAATGTLADSATLHRPKCRVAGASHFYRRNVARAAQKDIVCVEIKKDGDDSNRNKAKYRDGLEHFKNLNAALEKAKEGWRYHFKFLSPKDYAGFFGALKSGKIANWKSSLMQDLSA